MLLILDPCSQRHLQLENMEAEQNDISSQDDIFRKRRIDIEVDMMTTYFGIDSYVLCI